MKDKYTLTESDREMTIICPYEDIKCDNYTAEQEGNRHTYTMHCTKCKHNDGVIKEHVID